MKIYLILILCLSTLLCHGQNHPCYGENGLPLNDPESSQTDYSPKEFGKTVEVEINILEIKIGSEIVRPGFSSIVNVESETSILKVTDTLGMKLVIARAVEDGRNKYFYKLKFFKLDQVTECWKSIFIFTTFFEIREQTTSLNTLSHKMNSPRVFFEITEGFIKFH